METLLRISRPSLRYSSQYRHSGLISQTLHHAPRRRAISSVASTPFRITTGTSLASPPKIYSQQRPLPYPTVRKNTTSATTREARPLTDRPEKPEAEPTQRDVPAFEITFTCKPCLTRSTHRISKHGYEKGTVLITCPSCKNRHVISDHLGIFSEKNMTIEQLLAERGEEVKKGILSADGDIELWDDGTQTSRPNKSPDYPGPARKGRFSETRKPKTAPYQTTESKPE